MLMKVGWGATKVKTTWDAAQFGYGALYLEEFPLGSAYELRGRGEAVLQGCLRPI